MKIAKGEVYFRGTWKNPLLGGFGGVDSFKKPYMDKTLRNGLIMSGTNPLNHKWLDFGI
jgi:hypothetical protein